MEAQLANGGAPREVQLAGLSHAACGTDGFPVSLLDLADDSPQDDRVPIVEVRLDAPPAAPVLAGLAIEYEKRYGPTDVLSDATVEQFDPPDGVFVVLVHEGRTVAGGGLRRLTSDTAEIKRMWTSPADRRRGHGRAVLKALELFAVGRGYARVRMETGPAQPEAAQLYRHLGYREIPNYGSYDDAFGFERSLP